MKQFLKLKIQYHKIIGIMVLGIICNEGDAAIVSVSALNSGVIAGSTVNVDINIADLTSVPGDSLSAFDLNVLYDSQIFSLKSFGFLDAASKSNQLDLPEAGAFPFAGNVVDLGSGVLNAYGISGNSAKILDDAQLNKFSFLRLSFTAIKDSISPIFSIDQGYTGMLFLNSEFGDLSVTIAPSKPVCGSFLGSEIGQGKCIEKGTLMIDVNNQTITGALDLGATGGAVDSNSNNGTVSGVISGTGSLSKIGQGILALSGVNTYSGGTNLNGGTLSVANEANLGGLTGALNFNGGVLQVTGTAFNNTQRSINWGAAGGGFDIADPSNLFTVSQVLSGSGGLIKQGAGTLLLSGANTYTGGTTVDSGVLQGNSSSLQGDITNNASVVFDQATDGVYAGAMSGAGSLLKQNTRGLTLTGVNTYSGGTHLNGGTLSVANEANLGGLTGALNFNGGVLQVTGTTFNNTQRSINWGAAGGGFDIADPSNLFTVSQVLSGSGGLIKQGAGTLLLSGANTYSGGTTVDSGVLQGNSSSLQGDITNNASVVFDQATDGTYTGAMGGAGALLKQNTGGLTLTGINTYSGGTNLNGGTLSVANEANLGGLTGALNFNGGVLQVTGTAFNNTQRSINWGAAGGGFDIADPSNLFTVSHVLSGSGGLIKQGAGTLLLSGANTYTGGTTVNSGVLQGNSSSLQGDIANNASVVFDQATDGVYAGAMTGAGALLKQNTGGVTLTGVNTYGGGTTINQGILSVNGSLASGVTVNTDGTLRGTGIVSGNTSVAGRLAPGDSPGTLTFNGLVAMTPASTLEIDIDGTGTGNGAGNYSRVLVQGAGNTFTAAGDLQPLLRGITGAANNTFNPVIGQGFNIVNATGGINGTFSSLTQPTAGLPIGTRFDALYDANIVQLALTPKFYSNLPNIALMGNASAAGAALDAVRPAAFASKNSLFQALATLSEPQVAAALQQLDGEINADLLAASFNAHRLAGQAVSGRLADVRLGRSSSMAGMAPQNNESLVGLAANHAAQTLAAQANKNIWIRGMGGFMSTRDDTQAAGFNETLYGVMLGSDFAIADNLQLGAAVGYVHNQVNAGQSGNGATDSIQFLGYGLWHKNSEFLNFSFGYGRDNYTAQRSVNLGGNTADKSDVDGNSGSLDVEAGTRRPLGRYIVEPSLGVRGDIISRDAFTESGVAGLAVKSTTLSAAQTRLGAKISRGIEFGVNKRITPELRAYWLHDEGDSIASRSQATLFGQPISVSAANAGRDAASLGAGVMVEVGNNVALFADYNFELRNARNGQNVLGGLRVSW